MTNLLISYPNYMYSADTLTTPGVASGYYVADVSTGPRGVHYVASSATTSTIWELDRGAADVPNHMILARADLLRRLDSAACVWSVTGSASSAFASPETQTGSWNQADLLGPRAEDLVVTFTPSSFRYWRVKLVTTASVIHRYSKIYFGEWFDFGSEPIVDVPQTRAVRARGNREAYYKYTLTWKGVNNTVAAAFNDDILSMRDTHPVFLYDAGDLILNDCRILHCQITEASITPVKNDSNNVTVTFEEII
jgi:hypothetical protein